MSLELVTGRDPRLLRRFVVRWLGRGHQQREHRRPSPHQGEAPALVAGWMLDRRHPERPRAARQQWWKAVVVVGLALFLVAASPRQRSSDGSHPLLAGCVAAAGVLGVLALAHARRPALPARPPGGSPHRLAPGADAHGLLVVLARGQVHDAPAAEPASTLSRP